MDATLPDPTTDLPPATYDAVTLEDIDALDEHLSAKLEQLKDIVYRPAGAKPAPQFNASQLASLCGKTATSMLRLLEKSAKKLGLANGLALDGDGKRLPGQRMFTLEQSIDWVRAVRGKMFKRKPGQLASVITVGFFKGGVGKTTVAAFLAQGLSLKGYRVLAIDLDPQGSLSAMLGVDPGRVDEEETFTPLARLAGSPGHRETLLESVRPTYWSGIDIVAGSTGLFSCEMFLPLRAMNAQKEGKNFNFLAVLDRGLRGLKYDYDFIIIDTPPALSYTTMNAYLAADAILMPVTPEGLSLQSSAQFWQQFNELSKIASKLAGSPKTYAWLGVVPSKVEAKASSQAMLSWIRLFYGKYVLSSSLPLTEAVKTGGTEWASVYDISKYVGSAKTYARARDAFDGLVDEVETMTRQRCWHEQIGD